MFISKKFIPRRTFLRGAGITLGLPLLDSMVPAQTPLNKTAAAPVRRFLGIWHPHGAAPGYWSPLQEGANFEFSFITKPLEPFRNRVTLISGMDMPEAMATTEEPGGDHARGAVLLSGARPAKKRREPVPGCHHRSVDREEIRPGHDPRIHSARRRGGWQFRQLQLGLQLRVHELHLLDFAHAAAADRSESARGLRAPVRRRSEPGGAAPGRKQNASILDSVTQEIAFFKKPLGAGDRSRLDTYLENIREIERRIKIAMETTVKEPSEEIPFGLPENKHVHYRLMYDLLALAFEGDLTRSATFMLGKDLSGASFPESGFNGGWHGSFASRRQAGERGQLRQDEPVSRAEPGVLRRQAEQDTRWRWQRFSITS